MKTEPNISQNIVKLGLSKHEAMIYQLLTKEGSLSAKAIGRSLGILPNAVYRLCVKLSENKLVTPSKGYPKTFRALSPSVAITSYANEKILEIEDLKDKAIKDFSKLGKATKETQINLLGSRNEIFIKSVEMLKKAKKEVLIISIGEQIPEEVILANRDAISRGIQVKMICHKFNQDNRQLLESWQKMGWQIRHYTDWGFHLVVIDGINSILSVNNPKNTSERTGLEFFSSGLSKALRDYFYSVWKKAKEI